MFDTIFIMTGGGPGTQTYTASYYLYTVGFTQFHLSQATAGSWLFLIFTALVVMLLVRRLLQGGAGLMAARRHPPSQGARRRIPFGRILLSAVFLVVRAGADLLDVQHVDQAEQTTTWRSRRSGSPTSRRWCITRRRSSPIAAFEGLINSLIISLSRDDAFGAARHADGLQPGALQHRRAAPVVLGAVAALPAADRASSCRSS